jgi:8-oxo-dGTP diphosphatase
MALPRFAAFHETPEHGVPEAMRPAFAVMLARTREGVLLVHSRMRGVWELPGGLIDPGETPREAAERELVEESGCIARNTCWLGVVEVNDGRTHFGAVLACDTGQVPASFENTETMALGSWRRGDSLESLATVPIGPSDAALLARFG